MVSVGDAAPDFTAPLANGDISAFSLSEHLGGGPVVLAFFPAAFTGTCSHELETFENRRSDFAAHDASIYGVSVDLPFALAAFRDELGLSFPLISDTNRKLIDAYDVRTDFASSGVDGVAKRSVFVVDADGVVRYAWVSDDPGIEPDYDDVLAAVADLA